MPDREGFGGARFRGAIGGRAEPLGFWSMFGAVLLALVVMEALTMARDAYLVRQAVRSMQAEVRKLERQLPTLPEPMPQRASAPPPLRPATPSLPALPGPISARASNAPIACAGGRAMRRLPNGWEDTGERCRATSQ